MLFFLTRIAIAIAVIFAFVRLLRSKAKKGVKWLVSVLLIVFLLFIGSYPYENAFVSFDSPEEAFRCRYLGSAVEAVAPGRDCALVIGRQGGRYRVFAALKSEGGWKVGAGYDLSSRSSVLGDGVFVTLYTVRGADDTFVHVVHHGDRELDFSDAWGSDYTAVCYDAGAGYHYHLVNIPERVSEYALTINGETFPFVG